MPDELNKRSRLLSLARLRQSTRWDGYNSIADYHDGAYECDSVSPYTKTARNVDANIMVILLDWASDCALSGPLDRDARDLGYTRSLTTNINLVRLLNDTFGLSLSDVYGTNLFPFVKPGGMSAGIPDRDLKRAALEFALPQIDIVNPRLVICLGMDTFNPIRRQYGLSRAKNMEAAISSPFTIGNTKVWFQAHTGYFGQMMRNKGSVDQVMLDWKRMKDALDYPSTIPGERKEDL
ncbi:MAG: hypothetical protein WCJ35_04905 [Planctomycetota bacterium]